MLSAPFAKGLVVGIIDQSPRLALKTLTVATATQSMEANSKDPSTMSASQVTATHPRGSHAERFLRGVDPGNLAAITTARWNILTEAAR
jgi:hypothetical protein